MKIKIFEGDYGVDITLTPETVQEACMLLRLAANQKKEKPDISFRFQENKTCCEIWLKKLDPKKQNNSISKSLNTQ